MGSAGTFVNIFSVTQHETRQLKINYKEAQKVLLTVSAPGAHGNHSFNISFPHSSGYGPHSIYIE